MEETSLSANQDNVSLSNQPVTLSLTVSTTVTKIQLTVPVTVTLNRVTVTGRINYRTLSLTGLDIRDTLLAGLLDLTLITLLVREVSTCFFVNEA